MMNKLLIEPHYLGSIEYFSLLARYSSIHLELEGIYIKQSYRNRAYFLLSNKVQLLTVPVKFTSGAALKDVRIDYSQRWVKDHWGAFYSSYGKAPYFEFFSDEFDRVWHASYDYLIDLNYDFINTCLKLLQLKPELILMDSFDQDCDYDDYRKFIDPKKGYDQRNIYQPLEYNQLFGNKFVPNLSIVDLILNEGTESFKYLKTAS